MNYDGDAAIAAVLLGLLAAPSIAQDAEDEAQFRMMGMCRGCSFESLDVSGRKLMGINLTDSTLRAVTFDRSELGIAIFDYARLEDVSFEGADLGGASFRGAELINVSFEGTDLAGAVFEDARLVETDLSAGVLCNTQMPDETTDNSACD